MYLHTLFLLENSAPSLKAKWRERKRNLIVEAEAGIEPAYAALQAAA